MNTESLKDLNHEKPVRQNFGRPKTIHFSDTSSNKTDGSKNFSKVLDRKRKREEAAASATASELDSQHSGYQGSQRSRQRVQPENERAQIGEHNFMAESKIHAVGDDISSQRSLQEFNQIALPPLHD